jgi:dTDP-D-glucose 4,6-dehydratase
VLLVLLVVVLHFVQVLLVQEQERVQVQLLYVFYDEVYGESPLTFFDFFESVVLYSLAETDFQFLDDFEELLL